MNEDKVIQEIIDLKDEVKDIHETMATKDALEKIVQTQDEMLVILKRLDQERVFTFDIVKKMQEEMEEQKKKINEHDNLLKKVKLELKIA